MAFHHVPTFLRSALVRNPFCHGDIISIEDVLRLEAQYPNLFDKPDVSSVNTKDVPKAIKSEEQLKVTRAEKVKTTGLVKGSQKIVKTVPLSPTKKKSAPSQYHRNCLSSVKAGEEQKAKPTPRKRINVPPKPPQSIPTPNFTSMSVRNRKLTRPAQSFSLEDLRETLRQVMRDDALYNKPTLNRSPYTEDLVKKFLGRKLQSGHSQKTGKSSNYYFKREIKLKGFSGDESEINGQGDSGRAEQFEQRNRDSHDTGSLSTVAETTLLSPHRPLVLPTTKEKVKRVKSAPGFIRSFPQPPVVVYHRGSSSTMQKRDEKKQVMWNDKGKEGNEKKVASKHEARPYSKDEPHDMYTRKFNVDVEMQNDGIKPKSTRGTQIHIRSINLKKETEKQITEPLQHPPIEPILPTSSFRHLLAARSITSRYKMKGLLRKQDVEFCKTNERQRPAIPFREHEDVSHERRKASHSSSTTKVLEKIAKELVYTEILQQLHELKQQQTKAEAREKENHDDTHSISFSSPPDEPRQGPLNFVPTSADERKSESEEVPKSTKSLIGTLKTPELTPPAVPRPSHRDMKKKSPASSNNISLHTPELSPSLRKIVAMKKAQMCKQASHHNLDTDCSEMSDFIASEVEKDEKKGNHPEPNKSCQESLKLVTPQLSKSPVANTKLPSKTTKPAHKRVDIEIPELDASTTLSGVSTFQEENQPSLRENEGQCESQKDKVQMPTESPVKDTNDDELQQSETPKKEEQYEKSQENSSHQNTYSAVYLSESMSVQDEEPDMNVSGETVIDLLSEGEFIGTAYRSPGELSFRQPYRLASSTKSLSEHSPVTKPSLEESKDDGESELSFISSGLQIIVGSEHHANFSLGEYLQR